MIIIAIIIVIIVIIIIADGAYPHSILPTVSYSHACAGDSISAALQLLFLSRGLKASPAQT